MDPISHAQQPCLTESRNNCDFSEHANVGYRVAAQRRYKGTWLGHASFLIELLSVPLLSRGASVLFDPVFSDRCLHSQFLGPKRYTNRVPL
ncbi:hypothetical protein ARMSODRAFT_887633 [Armillaria solidipes]|uniref:Metallo-beta-lactamase domain-containing protein n=1 Tax=Armillaria solidipes TaxID=1076256 RepID=A0A2H3BQW6_9AGAR|nr:hypothetical protein ARMSODRAFT_887633 [Armillaria solidipes]